MTIQMPQIDVQGLLPVAGLVVIALAAAIAIVLWMALRSKVAMVIAVVVGVIVAGPMLVQAIGSIVSALVPMAVVLVAGVIGLVIVLGRNPEVTDLLRNLRPAPRVDTPPMMIDQPKTLQLNPGDGARVVIRKKVDQDVLDDWGFGK